LLAAGERTGGLQDTRTIARKRIALHLPDGTYQRHITNREAYDLVLEGKAQRTADKELQFLPSQLVPNMGATWQVKQSGYCGPLVLQVVT